ncbi:MAG: ATP-binding protein [Candidatus Eisenbacteria bacterium]|nr:ATP-binding protein [Candidatus Eisenbacteria bacterium]MCC7144758.1 ATP-binding protein [Candidatus Eisenbacteria bacterium]
MVAHDSPNLPEDEAANRPAAPHCLKVAFIGTHGVGKTTLTFELAARLKRRNYRVELVKEVARRCPLPLNRDTTLEAQAWILHTQIALEIESVRGYDVLICDRSALDNYAYLVAQCGRLEPYESVVREWIETYDLLAWVPPIERPSFDGVRDLDLSYQHRIHDLIADLVTEFGVSTLRLDPLTRDAWVDAVLDALPEAPLQLPLFGGGAE